MNTTSSSTSGIGLVELFLGSTVLAVAVLGTVGGMMTSLKLAIDSKESNIANDAACSVIGEFREAAKKDFNAALHDFGGPQVKKNDDHTVHSRIILDETRFDPPIDLNGDGDFDDTLLSAGQVHSAYIETRVLWGRQKSMTFVTLVSRNAAPNR